MQDIKWRRFGSIVCAAVWLSCSASFAQETVDESTPAEAPAVAEQPAEETRASSTDIGGIETAALQMVLIDVDTDTILASKNADTKMYPSSMTKLMTLYVVFERLKEGSLKLDNKFSVSEKAWRMQGSKMFVPIGAEVPLEDLIRGISVQSGNDACIVVAEGIAGSEEQFAKIMNDTAAKLGMSHSHFMNASGWPDENHYTTAHDLAILGERIIKDFPEYHGYASEPEYTYNNIRQANRNPLLSRKDLGVDGLKTGHTEAGGYGIVLSAKSPTDGRALLLVINGLDSEKARAEEGASLLTYGMKQFDNVTIAKPGTAVAEAPVWLGKEDKVALTVKEETKLNIPRIARDKISFKAIYDSPIAAPIAAGQEAGTLEVTVEGRGTKTYPLVAATEVKRMSAFSRAPRVIGRWLGLN